MVYKLDKPTSVYQGILYKDIKKQKTKENHLLIKQLKYTKIPNWMQKQMLGKRNLTIRSFLKMNFPVYKEDQNKKLIKSIADSQLNQIELLKSHSIIALKKKKKQKVKLEKSNQQVYHIQTKDILRQHQFNMEDYGMAFFERDANTKQIREQQQMSQQEKIDYFTNDYLNLEITGHSFTDFIL